MPPVSVTMQPRNLLAVLALLVPAGAPVVVDDEGALAEPQAASSKEALATATVMIDFLNSYLLDKGSPGAAAAAAGSLRSPNRPGHHVSPQRDFPKGKPAMMSA
jgi:hypothetical protein